MSTDDGHMWTHPHEQVSLTCLEKRAMLKSVRNRFLIEVMDSEQSLVHV